MFMFTIVRTSYVHKCIHTHAGMYDYMHNVTSWKVMLALPVRAFNCSPNHSVNLSPEFHPYDVMTFGIILK